MTISAIGKMIFDAETAVNNPKILLSADPPDMINLSGRRGM
jgi:hypothetical protein